MTTGLCSHDDRTRAFVDETCRRRTYGLAAVMVCTCMIDVTRKAARDLVQPGQRRLHFAKESDRRRKDILAVIARLPVRSVFATEVGKPVYARSRCWQVLVPALLTRGVQDVCIEAIDGGEERDRRDVRAALAGAERLDRLTYRHLEPFVEPMLWIADAVAWTAGADHSWRSRLGAVTPEQA